MGQYNEEGMDEMMVEMEEEEEERENGCERMELGVGGGDEEVRWQEFMPRMVLRVLLVEADDSTRHILTALLRKCNYKVAAFADGLQAWEILKRRHNSIDLILTELDLPSISGYALLTLITEHEGCKKIPVIIMSSEDSISKVLKCMLKGAADFLIKPVRKNELKNLWRHVWRRLAIEVGHTPQIRATGNHNVERTFENDSATNHSDDNASTSQRNSNCSEKATDAQDVLQMKYIEETALSHKETKHDLKIVKMEMESALYTSVTGESGANSNKKGNASDALREVDDGSCTGLATEDGVVGNAYDRCKANVNGIEPSKPCRGAIDLIGNMNKSKCIVAQSSSTGELSSLNSTPELELSLRRLHDSETKELDERQTLNHSNASAFSWYSSNKASQTSLPSSVIDLKEIKGAANPSPWPQTFSSGAENKPIVAPQLDFVRLPEVASDGGVGPADGPMFSSLQGPGPDLSVESPSSAFDREESPFLTSASLHSDLGAHSSTINNSSIQTGHEFGNRQSVERLGCSSSQIVDPSSSSTQCDEFADQKKIRASCGSASDLTDVNANCPGMAGTSSAVKEVVKDEGCSTFARDHFKIKSVHHSAEREAALAKFRLKRQGRCYEKKVRYQSRKKLAEQRPRVKGQFVRQAPTDQMLTDDGKL